MNPAIARGIVAQVNREIGPGVTLSLTRETPGGALLCRDATGRRCAIHCYNSYLTPIIRSVLRERVRGRGFSWLPNGQAGRNAVELARWDEHHRYQPTAEEAAQALFELHGPDWAQRIRSGHLRVAFLRIPLDALVGAAAHPS